MKRMDKKMNMSSGKRKSKVYIAGGLIILFTILLVPAAKSLIAEYRNANAIVARVNDEPVSQKELKQWMIFNRAGVYNYFMNKYGAQDSNEFWESSYSGEVPVDMARKNSLDGIVKIKVQQILARQEGLLQDISYEAFLREFDKENKSRKETIKNSKVVYGPSQYDIKEYFTYYFNNLIIKLKEKLSENEISFSDKDLNNYYESVKDKVYKRADYVKVYIPFEECKENVKTKYIDIKYDELIDKYVKEAVIQINKNVYNSTTM